MRRSLYSGRTQFELLMAFGAAENELFSIVANELNTFTGVRRPRSIGRR